MTNKGKQIKQKKILDFTESMASGESAPKELEGAAAQPRADRGAPTGGRGAAAESAGIQEILKELQLFRAEIANKTDRIEIKMDRFQTRFAESEEKIKLLEERVSELEDRLNPLENAEKDNREKIRMLSAAVDGFENRGRRNNVRLLGLPEGSEKGDPVAYFEKLIKDLLPEAKLTAFYSVVRAHRTLAGRPAPGAPPRAVIIRFLHFKDRDAVLTAAREKGEIRMDNVTLHFFQDLSLTVQKERKKFDATKQMLREKGIRYSMQFPAKLRVEHEGKISFFLNPKDACAFAEIARASKKTPPRKERNAEAVAQEGSAELANEIN